MVDDDYVVPQVALSLAPKQISGERWFERRYRESRPNVERGYDGDCDGDRAVSCHRC